MKLIIDISEYNVEYIKNAYEVPQDINMVIAEAIINGKQIPTPHGRLGDEAWMMKLITINQFIDWIDDPETIIEAERGIRWTH